jgi:hypothetical protein
MLIRQTNVHSRLTAKKVLLAVSIAVGWVAAPVSCAWAKPAVSSSPSRAEVRETCSYVANRGTKIQSELLRDASIDVRNDGHIFDATVGAEPGSAGGEELQFREHGAPKSSPPFEIDFFDDRPWVDRGFGARWLRHHGRTYALIFQSESLRHPNHLSFVDGNNREHLLCQFATTEHESLVPSDTSDAQLCRAAASGDVQGLSIDTETTSTLDYAGEPRTDTRIAGTTHTDFTNTGLPATVVQLEVEYGGARGWGAKYYDIVSGQKIRSDGRLHKLLMDLQYIEEWGNYRDFVEPGVANGSEVSLFTYGGVTYLDVTAKPPGDVPFHEVRLLNGNRISTVCSASFRVNWRVESIAREFR